jgi:hypothetical protein
LTGVPSRRTVKHRLASAGAKTGADRRPLMTCRKARMGAWRSLAEDKSSGTEREGNAMQTGHEGEVHHHKNKHLLERFEGYTDLIIVGLIIALGAAMLVGLLTANGKVTW